MCVEGGGRALFGKGAVYGSRDLCASGRRVWPNESCVWQEECCAKGGELCVGLYGHDADFKVHCCRRRLLTCLSGLPHLCMPAHACLLTQRCTRASPHHLQSSTEAVYGYANDWGVLYGGSGKQLGMQVRWCCAGPALGAGLPASVLACLLACMPAVALITIAKSCSAPARNIP